LGASAGISGHLHPGLRSLQAFTLFRDDFWRPVSASKNSVPGSRAMNARLDRTAPATPTFGPLKLGSWTGAAVILD
jgi:hypothetical protein